NLLKNNVLICEVIKEGVIDVDKYLVLQHSNSNSQEKSKVGPKDIIDISKLVKLEITLLSCMVDNAEHIKEIRELLSDDVKKKVRILARIETEKAIINFDSILSECDGIIIKLNSFYTKIPKEEV